jgi:hypothetical protein
MKLRHLLVILIFISLSCEKNEDDQLSGSDINLIKGEVQLIVDKIYKGCEEVNSGAVLESCYNSPDFTYLFNGTTLTYSQFSDALKAIFVKLSKQVITRTNEKIVVVDDATVLYTTNCTFRQSYKDGTTILIEPASMLFIVRKIAGKWWWIYGVESYGHY